MELKLISIELAVPMECFHQPMSIVVAAQPAGATAVLIINNMALGKPNVTATFTLDEIRFNASNAGAKVFDIWTQTLIGTIPAGAASYETVSFG